MLTVSFFFKDYIVFYLNKKQFNEKTCKSKINKTNFDVKQAYVYFFLRFTGY